MGAERRQSPRVAIDPPIRARVLELDVDVSIVDVSFGGFRVHSQVAFEQNAQFEFLVFSRAGTMRLEAIAMHSRALSAGSAVPFETGFAFGEGSSSIVAAHALIDSILSVLQTH